VFILQNNDLKFGSMERALPAKVNNNNNNNNNNYYYYYYYSVVTAAVNADAVGMWLTERRMLRRRIMDWKRFRSAWDLTGVSEECRKYLSQDSLCPAEIGGQDFPNAMCVAPGSQALALAPGAVSVRALSSVKEYRRWGPLQAGVFLRAYRCDRSRPAWNSARGG
jgi:hypothetical protein